jgi:hypothetical protein
VLVTLCLGSFSEKYGVVLRSIENGGVEIGRFALGTGGCFDDSEARLEVG